MTVLPKIAIVFPLSPNAKRNGAFDAAKLPVALNVAQLCEVANQQADRIVELNGVNEGQKRLADKFAEMLKHEERVRLVWRWISAASWALAVYELWRFWR